VTVRWALPEVPHRVVPRTQVEKEVRRLRAALKDVRELYARAAEPKELVVIDAADHLFDGKVGEVADAIEDLLGDW